MNKCDFCKEPCGNPYCFTQDESVNSSSRNDSCSDEQMQNNAQERSTNIEDMRFVNRTIREWTPAGPTNGTYQTYSVKRILQVKVNGEWKDVRLENEK